MRLPALLCTVGVFASLAMPASAQSLLPSRTFAPSLPAGAPEPTQPLEWWQDGGPRIRPLDTRVAELVEQGVRRSRLFSALVDRVRAGNVIVYVGMARAMASDMAGSLTFVGDGGRVRYLRVMLNPGLGTDQIIAALAHELEHVGEIIDSPRVRSAPALASLYWLIGRASRVGGRSGWETEQALRIGEAVRLELKVGAAAALARRAAARERGRRP